MKNREFFDWFEFIVLIIYCFASFVVIPFAVYALPGWELKLLILIFFGYPFWVATLFLLHDFFEGEDW
ncbi:MAG: hypothetical protein GF365_01070 [Candidatus Buchananbacteria bacterium]|nr:hypothetical protein [Candidatus Buchananbacteria bacterium]